MACSVSRPSRFCLALGLYHRNCRRLSVTLNYFTVKLIIFQTSKSRHCHAPFTYTCEECTTCHSNEGPHAHTHTQRETPATFAICIIFLKHFVIQKVRSSVLSGAQMCLHPHPPHPPLIVSHRVTCF